MATGTQRIPCACPPASQGCWVLRKAKQRRGEGQSLSLQHMQGARAVHTTLHVDATHSPRAPVLLPLQLAPVLPMVLCTGCTYPDWGCCPCWSQHSPSSLQHTANPNQSPSPQTCPWSCSGTPGLANTVHILKQRETKSVRDTGPGRGLGDCEGKLGQELTQLNFSLCEVRCLTSWPQQSPVDHGLRGT